MKLHQTFNQDRLVRSAIQKVYENVDFTHGFHSVLQSLQIEQVIKESDIDVKFTHIGRDYEIINEIRDGGISMVTEKWPYMGNPGTVTVIGQPDSLRILENVFERNGVKYDGQPVSTKIKINVQYHDELNPKLWKNEDELHPDVQEALVKVADEFFKFLDIKSLPVKDITITGSNANYNWTKISDLDVHLLVDMEDVEAEWGSLAALYFDSTKKNWNDTHEVKIKGVPIEVYVQNEAEEHVSTGVYSLKSKSWLIRPQHEQPDIDDVAVKAKVREWAKAIRGISKSSKPEVIEKLMDKLKVMRQSGLEEGGEFSIENIAFKTLRNNGYLDLLADAKIKAFDNKLSIEEEELLRVK